MRTRFFTIYRFLYCLTFFLRIRVFSGLLEVRRHSCRISGKRVAPTDPSQCSWPSDARMGEWGEDGRGCELFPGLSAAAGRRSHRKEGLASLAGALRTALAVAGKQLRVGGQECALPPRQTFGGCNGSRNLRTTAPPAPVVAAEHPLPDSPRPSQGVAAASRQAHRSCPHTGWTRGAPGSSRRQVKASSPSSPHPPLAASPPAERAAPLLTWVQAPLPTREPAKDQAGAKEGWPGSFGTAVPKRGSPGRPEAPVINGTGFASSSG